MLKILFIALAFLSGAVALSHELLWTRRLIDLLGATEAVTGRVLGLFFLGLSLGGWLATRWCRSAGNSAVRLGIAEASIAVLSLPAIFLPFWADGLISAIGIDVLVTWQGTVIKLLIAAAVVLPPAIAMGTTMPMFIRVITDLGGTVHGSGIWVYAINMIGGVFGLWFVSTSLLELTGVKGAMFSAAAGNLAIAVASFACSGKLSALSGGNVKEPGKATADVEPSGQKKSNGRFVFGLAFASGAIVLAGEVLILRLLNLVAPSSLQTTSALLANVIFFLALGSIAVAILNRFKISSRVQLMIGAIGAALFCAVCPLILYHETRSLASLRYLVAADGGTIDSLAGYWGILFKLVAVSSGAAMFFYGLVFPSVMSLHSSFDPRGRSVGLLLAFNGLGGLLGAEAANLFLATQIGIYPGFVIVSLATLMLVLAICVIDRRPTLLIGILLGAVCVAGFCYPPYQELTYLSPRTKKKFEIKETRFGRDGVLMVVETETKSRSLLMNNQYQLGSTGDIATERRQLLLPWLLHQEAKDVCCIGLATGITASGLEKVKSPPNVTAVELSDSVPEIARVFFAEQTREFFQRSGNRVVIEDGRTFMACANDDFDLIVADLFRPFGAGESRLFSVEHFRNVKRALRTDGLFCQWLPGHQLNLEHFETIAATFQSVFPNTLVMIGSDRSSTPIIGLCGWQDDRQWGAQEMVNSIQTYRVANGGLDRLVDNPQLLIVGVLKKTAVPSTRLNTLDNAMLEIDAGRFWIMKDLRRNQPPVNLDNGFLSNQNWKRFVLKLIEDTDPVLQPIHRKELLDGIRSAGQPPGAVRGR